VLACWLASPVHLTHRKPGVFLITFPVLYSPAGVLLFRSFFNSWSRDRRFVWEFLDVLLDGRPHHARHSRRGPLVRTSPGMVERRSAGPVVSHADDRLPQLPHGCLSGLTLALWNGQYHSLPNPSAAHLALLGLKDGVSAVRSGWWLILFASDEAAFRKVVFGLLLCG